MDSEKRQLFRNLLLAQLTEHARLVSEDQAAAINVDDGAKESVDLAVRDVIEALALKLGEKESQMVADIDQALLRLDEGTFGFCAGCGKPIDERRLEAMPTARYDAPCQAMIEKAHGNEPRPKL